MSTPTPPATTTGAHRRRPWLARTFAALGRFWRDASWTVLVVAGLVVLVLGAWGFARYDGAGAPQSALSQAYWAMGLFLGETGAVEDPVPWQLNIARFLAPAVVAGAAIGAFASLAQHQGRRLRSRFARGHLIVVGTSQRAVHLARDARTLHAGRRGRPGSGPVLVAVGAEAGERLRRSGVPVRATAAAEPAFVDDDDLRDVLRKARIGRAAAVAVLTDSPALNARTVRTIVSMKESGEASAALHSFVEVESLDVMRRLAAHADPRVWSAGVEFFHAGQRAASLLVDRIFEHRRDGEAPPHDLILGDGELARSVALQLARRWSREHRQGVLAAAPRVSMVRFEATTDDAGAATAAARCARRLTHLYPRLAPADGAAGQAGHATACLLETACIDPDDAGWLSGRWLVELEKTTPLRSIIVAADGDGEGLHLALQALGALKGRGAIPVFLCTSAPGEAETLGEGSGTDAPGPTLATFSVLDEVFREDAIRNGMIEAMASSMHEGYRLLDAPQRRGPTWAQLSAEQREWNYAPVRALLSMLAAAGYAITPHTDADAEDHQFPPGILDALARQEHQRWCEQRRADGWVYGPARDDTAKISPCLLAWDDERLGAACRHTTCEQIRRIPIMLAAAGLQARRVGPGGHGGPAGDEAARLAAARTGRGR